MFYIRVLCFTVSVFVLSGNASLFEYCDHGDSDCDVMDSHCVNNFCKCRESFLEFEQKCWMVSTPKKKCFEDDECNTDYGSKSLCKNSTCVCIPYFHQDSYGICIKNRGYYEHCRTKDQCYWGYDMLDKLDCINSTCVCKAGYQPGKNRKCVEGDGTSPMGKVTSLGNTLNRLNLFIICIITVLLINLY